MLTALYLEEVIEVVIKWKKMKITTGVFVLVYDSEDVS